MTRRSIVLRHMLFWLIFIAYEVAYLKFTVGALAPVRHFIIYYTLNIFLFYFNAFVILEYAFFKTKKPWITAICLTFFELIGYLAIKFILDYFHSDVRLPVAHQIKYTEKFILINIWRGVYIIGFSIAYRSMLSMVRFKERNYQMETEQLKSVTKNLELENKYIAVENAYLQNQISPHLLFNSLNFIYTSVHLLSEKAGKGVMRLSNLMRYSLVSTDDARTVLLSEEVGQMENLVELCHMRFGEGFYLKFRKKGRLAGLRIIPLSLITLVENIMKHGDLGDKHYPAQIILEIREKGLLFETRNRKKKTRLYAKGGVGLKNIEKRLMNYYQERCSLLIRDVADFYTVTLTITDL